MKIIGFTGTRHGMSQNQKGAVREAVYNLIGKEEIVSVLHGGCIGADMDFHEICEGLHREVYPGHSVHDPTKLDFRGNYQDADVIYDSRPFFERNRIIVDRCDILIATPYNMSGKGGTWHTIEYAKIDKPILIIHKE